jgi:peptide deformylase
MNIQQNYGKNKMKIKILEPKDERLREVSSEITDFDNPIYQKMLNEIKEICIEQKAYASAAPQFGILKRFIIIMTAEEIKVSSVKEFNELKIDYKITAYFNPIITTMIGKQYFFEACMSVENATGKVARPYKIVIEAQDINGNRFIKEAEGFEAIVLCHEIDHLDGIEYTDRAEELYYDVDVEARIKIRQDQPHQIIDKTTPFVYTKSSQIIKRLEK